MRDYAFRALNQPVDPSVEFATLDNLIFTADRATAFEAKRGAGVLEWTRHALKCTMSFNQIAAKLVPSTFDDCPTDYRANPTTPFEVSFVSPRTVRLRVWAMPSENPLPLGERVGVRGSLMLAKTPKCDRSWKPSRRGKSVTWKSRFGSLALSLDPWRVELRDASGKLLTRTLSFGDTMGQINYEPTPWAFAWRASDRRRRIAASFALAPDEKLFGCGESFTRLDKRGQKVTLWTTDAIGAQTRDMYKPIPFFLSSRGYGMFVHTSTAATLDFGATHDGALVVTPDDDAVDLFIFLGSPKEILSEYTALTGRAPVPPAWSFGLWMSRITYFSEREVRGVAAKLRKLRVPCDVIHVDTGWFESDWRCDYEFAKRRFPNPWKMLADLRKKGFRVSLWQLPYFTPANPLFPEIVAKGLAVRDGEGKLPTEDAILDFSNPDTVRWYAAKLARLLKMGVAAIKVDFGEAAPLTGQYASGLSGVHEHNLYPLRYNKAASEATHDATGEWIIWARSAWAGSQRYPIHWGGDAENSAGGMAGTLRAGLSLGLSGFTFWSHDIGGFCKRTPEDVYRRWLPFGMLTSHSRCHGVPPKEPWFFGKSFTDYFRRVVEMKYRLMPYVYAQSVDAARHGLPMVRALFIEYPDDPTSWLVEDEYLFGRDILVAPLFDPDASGRDVYLPPGAWVDYQTGARREGARWHTIAAGPIECVILVREGAAIPHAALAQHTGAVDWTCIELAVFGRPARAEARFCLPGETSARTIVVRREGSAWEVEPGLPGRRRGKPGALKRRTEWRIALR